MIHSRRPFTSWLMSALLGVQILTGCASQGGATHTPETESPSSAYTQLGFAYLQRNDADRAQQAFERAIDLSPNDPDALQGLALIYQRQGDIDSADRYFQRALRARNNFTQARNNYAAFLFSQHRISQACEQLERATDDLRYERRAQLYANLGQCRERLGDSSASLTAYQRALQLDDNLARAWLGLARAQYQQHQHDAARQSLGRYVQLVGHSDESIRLTRQLDATEVSSG